ncbi:interleukin-8-like [Cololabis saira]|uniref:interleukin-8-like n=1 Tax=Cololabis saira TaxID=129043 RepID=UPI002AD2A329|nr:interleukin-8-like [Cololabis saira]
MSPITAVALLVFLVIHEGGSVGEHGVNLRCKCITKEKRPIGRHIRVLEVHPPNSHCNDMELVAILKKDGQKICLDPDARWVKLLKKRLLRQKP